jgi:hypothetical protein
MSTRVRRLLTRIGRRGAALLFFCLLDVVYCFALLNPPRPLTPVYAFPAQLMPLWAWALSWAAVAVLCAVFAFVERDTPAFVAAEAIKVAWGLTSLFGWMAGVVERGYISAAIWLAFAVFVYLIAGGIPPPPPRRRGNV